MIMNLIRKYHKPPMLQMVTKYFMPVVDISLVIRLSYDS